MSGIVFICYIVNWKEEHFVSANLGMQVKIT
jgi:hypothetical protein